MADDWRINQKYRKPRQSKGTPFFYQRNYLALGGVVAGAVFWFIFDRLPSSQQFKHTFFETDKFKLPEGYLTKRKHFEESFSGPPMQSLLYKAREREF